MFGNEPNRSYEARIVDPIGFNKLLRGRKHLGFSISFNCQPFKNVYPATTDISVAVSGTKVSNPGTVASEPTITVYGAGDITLTIGFDTVHLTDVAGGMIIDSGMQDCLSIDKGSLWNWKMTGAFPKLATGENTIKWAGNVSRVVITPNWRYL